MSFHEIRFPDDIAYGSKGGPTFSTSVIEADSGYETRVSHWERPRYEYDVSYGVRSHDQLSTLLTFFTARRGPAYGFRFKDFSDFTSAANHRAAPSYLDQALGIGNGSATTFQLVKAYTDGAGLFSTQRIIRKPVAGTVVIGSNGSNLASGWSFDPTTGIVTFSVAPVLGTTLTAGFEFDVPVRFAAEMDTGFQIDYEGFGSGSVPSIKLVEIIDVTTEVAGFFYGGAATLSFSATTPITHGTGRAIILNPSATNLQIRLPDHTFLPTGGPYFLLYNSHATRNVNVYQASGAGSPIAIAGLTAKEIWLGVDGSGNKLWIGV